MSEVLTKYFNEKNIELAYYRVMCWSDRMVKDRFGIQAFGSNLQENIESLCRRMHDGTYRPQNGFKFYEPKSSGTQRTKTLLMIDDAIVYQAIANVIAQNVYKQLAEHENFVFGSVLTSDVIKGTDILDEEQPNYFFFKFWKSLFGRFKESVIKAIEIDKATYKFETDITGFFDSIPHYNLLMTLSVEFGVEDEILDILSQCFNVWSGTKESSTPGVGIPQGVQPSFLLANLLLHPLDKQVIGEAHKYYRYMDDIKIYGYSEEELEDVLVKIDNYLKGRGLSINSKKTSIRRIEIGKEDATVKEFRRFILLGENYDGDISVTEIDELNDAGLGRNIEKDVTKNLSSLHDQSPDGLFDMDDQKEIISDPEELIRFWEGEIDYVENYLPGLFKPDSLELIDPESSDDIEFIRLSAKYGVAIGALRDLKPRKAEESLLKYWLFALRKYFWRANNYCMTLQHYRDNAFLKQELFSIYLKDKNYECYRYHLINCLAYNFKFTDKELRDCFKILKDESSDLVKYSIYSLIIKNSTDHQLQASIKSQLANEKSNYLKLMVLSYWKTDVNRINSMNDLIKSIGL